LHDFFHDRRIRHTFELGTVLDCLRLCKRGTEIQFNDGRRVRLETNLGFKLGTRVFLEEILSRYYYNFILGLVYAGAMVVLITVGMYLAGFPLWLPLAGFGLEALFLLGLAVVTSYTPPEDSGGAASPSGKQEGLMTSMNNTLREMTNAVSDLFRLVSQADIRQDVLLTRLTEQLSRINAENIRKYSEKLDESNVILNEFVHQAKAHQDELVRQQGQAIGEIKRLVTSVERSLGNADQIPDGEPGDKGKSENRGETVTSEAN